MSFAARELRTQRERAVVGTPHGGYLYVKHLPRRVKHAVKKGILLFRLTAREYRAVDRYLRREGQRDQGHRFRLPKKRWGAGPWQDEPDYLDFVHAGLHCAIVRNMHVTGTLNGYVGVPPSHPWWGKAKDECLAVPQCPPVTLDRLTAPPGLMAMAAKVLGNKDWWSCEHTVSSLVEVHGGVNWASHSIGSTKRAHHDLWWFAFDTGHAWDLTPMMEATLREVYRHRDPSGREWAEHERVMAGHSTYKDLPYVRHALETLAEQVAMAAHV